MVEGQIGLGKHHKWVRLSFKEQGSGVEFECRTQLGVKQGGRGLSGILEWDRQHLRSNFEGFSPSLSALSSVKVSKQALFGFFCVQGNLHKSSISAKTVVARGLILCSMDSWQSQASKTPFLTIFFVRPDSLIVF